MAAPTVSQQREFELQVTGRALVPRSVYDPIYAWMLKRRVKTVLGSLAGTAYQYSAFPRSPAFRDVSGTLHNMTTDGRVILLWADGPSHGESERVILALVDPETLETEASVMRGEGGGALDVSILTGKLALGQAIMMARFHIRQPSDGSPPVGTVQPISATTFNIHGGNRGISPWSRPKRLANGDWVRMGFQTNTADSPAVFLRATDDTLATWQYRSTVAYNAAPYRYIEGDFVETSAGNLLAWFGETKNDDIRYLWYNTSTDSGATWSTPTLYDTNILTGNQPCLDLLVSGQVQGMVSDRSGTSGLDNNGMPIDNTKDRTGIAHFLSLDTSATDFRYRTMLAPFRGTDGGQCTVVEYEAGKIFFAYYGVRRIDELPKIVIGTYEVEKLIEGY